MIERHEELMHRYLDECLSADESTEFDAMLAENAELAEEVETLQMARSMMRDDVEAAVQAADFSGFAARIQAEIADIEVAPAAVERAPVPAEPEETGLRAWWRRNWTPLVVSGAAVAVIVALLFQSRPAVDDNDPMSPAGVVTVDSIENGGTKTVRVSMPAEDGEATVIWMLDEEEEDAPDGGPAAGEDPI